MLLNATHALSAVALEEFDRQVSWAADGALTGPGWAAARTGTSARLLRARCRAGAGLRFMSDCGALGQSGAHECFARGRAGRLRPSAPRPRRPREALLVDQAQRLDADAFGVAARHWRDRATAVDSPDPATTTPTEPVDELHLSGTFDGRYRLDGTFSAETGQLAAALDAHVDHALRAARDGDPSVPLVASRVRAAALVDLVAQSMRREPSDSSVPDRYRVAIVVTHDAQDPPLEVCDSPAFRVVLGARSEVLDVGRLTQLWPPAIRRAITHRDLHCVFPGCDRSPSWRDIHHCLPWKEGGATTVDNGALLCRRHHTFIHKQNWSIRIEHGKPITRKADGTQHLLTRWDCGGRGESLRAQRPQESAEPLPRPGRPPDPPTRAATASHTGRSELTSPGLTATPRMGRG